MPRTKHSYVNVHLFDNVHLVNSSSKAALEKGGNVAKMLQRCCSVHGTDFTRMLASAVAEEAVQG
jgi:hypothetical protein